MADAPPNGNGGASRLLGIALALVAALGTAAWGLLMARVTAVEAGAKDEASRLDERLQREMRDLDGGLGNRIEAIERWRSETSANRFTQRDGEELKFWLLREIDRP